MSLSTYGALQASIAAWATRDDLSATIPDFVAWAQEEIGRRLRANFMLSRADVPLSGEFADVPDDFAAIKTFRLDVSPRVKLTVTSPEGVEDAIDRHSAVNHPWLVAVEGNAFHFGPLFGAAITGKLLYFTRPEVMVADSDANAVLLRYPYLYLYGSLEALFRYLEDDNNADRYGAQFGALLQSINDLETKDAMSGPIQMTASGAVV